MKLIVGLGNPGSRYAGTRHNAGRLLVESIAEREGLKWSKKKSLQATVAKTQWGSEEILLAYPDAFINISGTPVSMLVEHSGVTLSRDLLIVVDDVALPFGKLRLRGKGTDGGHNGLKSIHQALASTAYPRLRIGIAPVGGPEEISDMVTYVLESFDRQEKKALNSVLEKASEGCRLWAEESLAAAMNVVNP